MSFNRFRVMIHNDRDLDIEMWWKILNLNIANFFQDSLIIIKTLVKNQVLERQFSLKKNSLTKKKNRKCHKRFVVCVPLCYNRFMHNSYNNFDFSMVGTQWRSDFSLLCEDTTHHDKLAFDNERRKSRLFFPLDCNEMMHYDKLIFDDE